MELVANRSVVELELRRALGSRRSNLRNKVLLLRAAPQWRGEAQFPVEVNGAQIPVTVAACPTVLAVLDALAGVQADGRYVVVLTPCDTRDVGDSVLARALQPEICPLSRHYLRHRSAIPRRDHYPWSPSQDPRHLGA